MTEPKSNESRRTSGRSPGYPGIDLPTAIARAQAIYANEARHPTNVDTILKHWGYQPRSGGGMVALAALKKFGLLSDEGSGAARRAKLTDLAVRLILDTRADSSERNAALKQAALMPAIHRELWEEFRGELPSPENLRFQLVFNRGFTESGASEFIAEFRRTLDFAGLAGADSASELGNDIWSEKASDAGGAPHSHESVAGTPPLSTGALPLRTGDRVRAFALPVQRRREALLQVPADLDEADWKMMIAVLKAMKPGIVGSAATDTEEVSDDDLS
jgi:hypothetical protein